jgi:hypothetical protein
MVGSYQMVLINLIGILLVFGAALFYKYIFPKKQINFFALLIALSLLPVVSLLRFGDYESGDFNIHVYRTMAFYQNLLDGNLMPSWAGILNGTYGYPLFIFLNPLPYYLISIFHTFGFSFISSLKLFLGAAFIFSGISMYLLIKEILKNDRAALAAAVFYLFFPYHLVDLHFRSDIGEILCFTLLPILLFFTYRLFKNGSLMYLLWTGLSFALLIMAHQAIALLSLFLVAAFLLTQLLLEPKRIRQIKLWLKIALAFVLGILISGYTWLPYLIYAKDNLSATLFKTLPSFVSIQELFYSPWRYGFLFQGPKGELSFLLGYTEIFMLVFLVAYLTLKRGKAKYAKELTIWLATTAFLIFMLTSYSQVIWVTVPVIKNMLMSSRVLLILTVSISILAGYWTLINKDRKIFVWLVIILTIGTTILNWGHRRIIPEITDKELTNNLPYSSYQGEGLAYIGNSVWFSNKPIFINQIPFSRLEVLEEQASIKIINITNTNHLYSVTSTTGALLKENTLYYPGWTVTVNGKRTNISFTDKKYPGLIIFTIPKGNSEISVSYRDLPLLQWLKFGFVISLIAILSFTLVRIMRKRFF